MRIYIKRLIKSLVKRGGSQTMDSSIGEHLLTINSCRTNFEDDCFSVLHRARDKIHLKVLEAIYIAINRPPLCRQLSTHILNIFGELLETGVTWFFFSHLVSLILIINSNTVFRNFPVTSLTKCQTKGPSLFYYFRMVQETGVQSQVESYQRLKKWYSMPPCLTLSIIWWGSRVKWSNPGKRVAPSPTPRCRSCRKGSRWVTLN